MPAFFFIAILLHTFPMAIVTDSGLQAPPHISGDVISKYTAKIGDTVRIDCPIDSPTLPMYDWSKDGETITAAWERRFRVTGKKLRIKGVVPQDGGVYVCKAINGFGSNTISTRLLVYDEKGEVVGGNEEPSTGEKSPDDGVVGIPPIFTETSRPPSGQTFRQSLGSSLTLRCGAEGPPFPQISWLKDGQDLPEASGEQQFQIKAMTEQDVGTYECVHKNDYGQKNASFVVELATLVPLGVESDVDESPEGPSWITWMMNFSGESRSNTGGPHILSLDPSTLTVERGKKVAFRCRIQSDMQVKIQWFHEVKDMETESEGIYHLGDEKYKSISQTSWNLLLRNGSYLSELSLDTDLAESGSYVCLAANTAGYNFQKSFLKIVQSKRIGSYEEEEALLPFGALIAIPATLGFLFLALALVICCVRKGQPDPVSPSATYATPRDVAPPPHPFYKPRSFPPSRTIPPDFDHQFFSKGPPSPAYASVPICEPFGPAFGAARPPLPCRNNFSVRNYTNNGKGPPEPGLLTQPLLTQTASSSDSRESRQSGGCRPEFPPQLHNFREQCQWGSSGGSDASFDPKRPQYRH